MACGCGGSAKFVNWRPKSLVSLFGEIRLPCSYYHCRSCQTSQQPWDQVLGLTKRRVTPAAEEAITLAGLLTSFGQAARQTLLQLTGIRVSESTVRRVTEDAGEELGQALCEKQTFGPTKTWPWQRDAQGQGCAYASIDHVSVPQQGARGAKADGRMAAVAMVYNPQSEHEENRPRATREVRYLAGLYELDALSLLLRRQAAQVGWDAAPQQLVLSDAGNGLEDFGRKSFPLATSILDFYHASEHVTEMAKALEPRDDKAAARQLQVWCHQLKHDGGAALLAEWEQLDVSGWSPERQEIYRRQTQYFRNHQHRMNYPRFIRNGWQIGSGPVESGCKRLVTLRLKGPGMRWKPRGTTTLCHLRALLLGEPGQWENYWNNAGLT